MDILVIGNGFDLAHGLPTKYTDFLKWIIKEVLFFNDLKEQHAMITNEISEVELNIPESMRRMIIKDQEKLDRIEHQEELWEDINYNWWVEYFLQNVKFQKENWIDFEHEISKVIQFLDMLMFKEDGERYELSEEVPESCKISWHKKGFSFFYSKQDTEKSSIEEEMNITFRDVRDRLYNDLNRLIRVLEIYLTEYVEQKTCTVKSPDIDNVCKKFTNNNGQKEAQFAKVISFNYTKTYERIYLDKVKGKNIIDYIHGKANRSNSIKSNNMVLGIDEYLPDDRIGVEVDFIAFKKFYQRIYKETGCKYKEWVEQIKQEYLKKCEKMKNMFALSENQNIFSRLGNSALQNEKCKMHNLYIFGHSLDVTDKDILKELILNNNVHTIIFYLNKDVMGQQIANLVKVIGQDELIRRTGERNIEFKQQSDMIKIGGK